MILSGDVPEWAEGWELKPQFAREGALDAKNTRFVRHAEENPLLVIRAGAYGALDPDLLEELAQDLGAAFVSGAAIKSEIMEGKSVYSRELTTRAKEVFADRVSVLLADGYDVVGDMAFNSVKTRQSVVAAVAREAGVVVVGVNAMCDRRALSARMERLVLSGVIEGIPVEAFKDSPVRVALGTERELREGTQQTYISPLEPGIDYVFTVNGAESPNIAGGHLLGDFLSAELVDD